MHFLQTPMLNNTGITCTLFEPKYLTAVFFLNKQFG